MSLLTASTEVDDAERDSGWQWTGAGGGAGAIGTRLMLVAARACSGFGRSTPARDQRTGVWRSYLSTRRRGATSFAITLASETWADHPRTQLARFRRNRELRQEQAAEQARQHALGKEGGLPARDRTPSTARKPTARHDAVEMRMVREHLTSRICKTVVTPILAQRWFLSAAIVRNVSAAASNRIA